MKNKFDFKIELDPQIDPYNSFIPSMLLQPVVENSIWHGINYLNGKKGEIILAFKKNGAQTINIIIEDNGIGLTAAEAINKKKNHRSKGNSLLRDRLDAMNATRGEAISFSIAEISSGGTRVIIKIPAND